MDSPRKCSKCHAPVRPMPPDGDTRYDPPKVMPLRDGDSRCQTLLDALAEVLYERGKGLPLPSTIGVLELLKYEVIENARLTK